MLPRHVYVHVPFCARRCSYCDFAITVREQAPAAEFIDALEREIALRVPQAGEWPIDTLYLGGGTPSHLGADGVAHLLAMLRTRMQLTPGAEVTLEANPDDVTGDSADRWLDAGVTRVSLGAQSFSSGALEWMHRTHGPDRIVTAARTLAQSGVKDWSLDLIFALPETLGRDWAHDLSSALELAPSHLSLYGLTVEPHTAIAHWRDRGQHVEGGEDAYVTEYLLAHERATAAGYEHYEVSNFARPGFRSRHNGSYWTGAAYAGFGPSAHEFDGLRRRWNIAAYSQWLARLREHLDPVGGEETLTAENRVAEDVYLGLRTTAGLVLMETEMDLARTWCSAGWASLDERRLGLTAEGWLRMDALASALTAIRSH